METVLDLQTVFVQLDAVPAVLSHGALHALASNEEHCAPTNVYAAVYDALQVVDYEGGSGAPFRPASPW